jgi:Tol biopolymer transport system component
MDVNSFIIEMGKPWGAQSPQPLPRLSGGAYLTVSDWSRDGRTLAGAVRQLGGPVGIGIYSLGQQEFERLTDRGNWPHWLSDGRRLLFDDSGRLYLVDSRSRKVHEVLSAAPYEVFASRPSRDGRWIYFIQMAREADIWQMSVEAPSH